MKTAISVPDPVFRKADQFARRCNMSRSAVFTKAVEEFLARQRRDDVTAQLDRVHSKTPSELDPVLQTIQTLSLPREEW